jgi:hypothetical protein
MLAPALAANVVHKYDTDNDRTLDLAEVKAGADKAGTLSAKELKSKSGQRLSRLIDETIVSN